MYEVECLRYDLMFYYDVDAPNSSTIFYGIIFYTVLEVNINFCFIPRFLVICLFRFELELQMY
jgi:hypothetical protein